MFTGTVSGFERARRSVVATKGELCSGIGIGQIRSEASEEVWSDCYKGLRSGAGGAAYSSRYQRISGFWWGATYVISIKGSV